MHDDTKRTALDTPETEDEQAESPPPALLLFGAADEGRCDGDACAVPFKEM